MIITDNPQARMFSQKKGLSHLFAERSKLAPTKTAAQSPSAKAATSLFTDSPLGYHMARNPFKPTFPGLVPQASADCKPTVGDRKRQTVQASDGPGSQPVSWLHAWALAITSQMNDPLPSV
jgi:hypothetical protein